MKVYQVSIKKQVVGVITEKNKITVAHPAVGKVVGKSIEEFKALCKKNKWHVRKVYPNGVQSKGK